MRNRIGATEEEIASVKRLTAAQQQIGIIGDEILRGTTQGELQALKNDFGDLKEEIGATFQPLLGVLIPMVSGGSQRNEAAFTGYPFRFGLAWSNCYGVDAADGIKKK